MSGHALIKRIPVLMKFWAIVLSFTQVPQINQTVAILNKKSKPNETNHYFKTVYHQLNHVSLHRLSISFESVDTAKKKLPVHTLDGLTLSYKVMS